MKRNTSNHEEINDTVDPISGRRGSIAEVTEDGIVKMHTSKVASCYVGGEKLEVEGRTPQFGLQPDKVDAFEQKFKAMPENEKVAAILQAMRG